MRLGISVDGSHARAVVVDGDARIVARSAANASESADAMVEAARAALASVKNPSVDAVGLAFPDPDPKSWPDTSLLAAAGVSGAFRSLSIGNAQTLAEAWDGAAKGAKHAVVFSIGPCVSAGVISNGVLLSGAHGVASSVAWLALNPVERDDYRRLGCLESEGGSAGIVKRLVWRIKSGDRSRVLDTVNGNFADITLEHVLKAARAGDGVSISVIRDTVKYLAMAVSNMAAVIDPEVIVLGGVLQDAADLMFEPIKQECARRMPPAIYHRARIETSPLGPDAAALGAARFALTGTQLP